MKTSVLLSCVPDGRGFDNVRCERGSAFHITESEAKVMKYARPE
ncbi:hypothetical protein [uncultured Duncaniella sp.]|nr:hypothetical protein [uncultured Duncaniella sp.]